MKNKRFRLFFFLVLTYIVIQSSWWMYSIYELSKDLYSPEQLKNKQWMIFGEGLVFLFLLVLSFMVLFKSIKKELRLSQQQKNFLMSITHELKTPIASIKLYLQTLLKRNLDKEKQIEILHKSVSDTDRLNNLLETILVATKVEDHSYSFEKNDLNLSALTKEVCIQLMETNQKQIDVDFRIQEDVIFRGDQDAIISIVTNLMSNALKYSPSKSTVIVELTQEATHTTLRVSDEGNGIPAQERDLIFNKFYRIGDENTRKEQGTGLGLFIVKYLVEQHNGEISVRKNQPKGAIFACKFNTIS